MKLTFLGTAAAEGFPAVFCNCRYCRQARELGESRFRTRSQALINENLLLDLPADTYFHFLKNGIRGDKIATLLLTHSHSDHFYPLELEMHGSCYAHDMAQRNLDVVCSEDVAMKLMKLFAEISRKVVSTLTVHVAKPFVPMHFGTYTVTPFPARHAPEEQALFYLIEESGKRLLYAHDTGYFYESVFEYIEQNRLTFDGVSLDCTNGTIPIEDTGTHMGFDNVARVLERLRACGAVHGATALYVNHFSHNAAPLQEHLESLASPIGCAVAYDGLSVEL